MFYGAVLPSAQLRWRHKNGTIVWLEYRLTLIRNATGETVAVEGIARDVTAQQEDAGIAQRHLEEVNLINRIMQSTTQADNLPAALQEICKNLAHFFGSPQAGVATFNADRSALVVMAEYQEKEPASGLGIEIPVQGNDPVAYILAHKKPLAVEDAQHDPIMAPVHGIMHQRNVCAILLIPILVGDEVIGTLGFDFRQPRKFSNFDLALAENIANQLGEIFQHLELFSRKQEQTRLLAKLTSLSETLNRSFTVSEVISAIGRGAMALTVADRAIFFLRQSEHGFSIPWSQGLSPDYLEQVHTHFAVLPGYQLLYDANPVLVTDFQRLPADSMARQIAEAEGHRAFGLWPLIYQDPRAGCGRLLF